MKMCTPVDAELVACRQVFENGVLTKEWTKYDVSAAAAVYNSKGVAAGTVMPGA